MRAGQGQKTGKYRGTVHRLCPQLIRAAWWALRAARRSRRAEGNPLATAQLPRLPELPDEAQRAVTSVLRRTKATCLVRSQVTQAWDAAHGRPRDLLIGVRDGDDGFGAHAWLDGDAAESSEDFKIIHRHPAPTR